MLEFYVIGAKSDPSFFDRMNIVFNIYMFFA